MGMKIMLDMDGVIVDFLGGAARAHNRPLPYSNPKWYGEWNTEKGWGITSEQFWKPINEDPNFWEHLEKTPEADQIVFACTNVVGMHNIAILTSPDRSSNCFTGKVKWMKKNYPQLEGRMIFSRAKEFMSSPQRILVDDKDSNIENFRKEGGHGVLVPRVWNSDYKNSDKVLMSIEVDLHNILKGFN